MADPHLDLNRHDVVDLVASRMTAADAPANLRARVLDRIADAPRTAPHARWVFAGLIAAGAAAALVVTAVLSWRSPEPTAPIASSPVTTIAASHGTEATQPNGTNTVTRAARARRPAPRQTIAPGLPALATPTPIALETIQPGALSIPQLEVTPIVTAPIRVSGDIR